MVHYNKSQQLPGIFRLFCWISFISNWHETKALRDGARSSIRPVEVTLKVKSCISVRQLHFNLKKCVLYIHNSLTWRIILATLVDDMKILQYMKCTENMFWTYYKHFNFIFLLLFQYNIFIVPWIRSIQSLFTNKMKNVFHTL